MWLPIVLVFVIVIIIVVVKNKDGILVKLVQKNSTAKLSLLSSIASGNANKLYQELILGLSKSNLQFVDSKEAKNAILLELYIFLVNQTVDTMKNSSDKSLELVKGFLVYKADEIVDDGCENLDIGSLALSRIEEYSKNENKLGLLSSYISSEIEKQNFGELKEEQASKTQHAIVVKDVIEKYCLQRINIYTDGVASVFNGKNEFSELTVTEIASLFKDAIKRESGSI